MGVRKQVFASKAERGNFEKLMRHWSNAHRLYHNLPFLNVFDGTNLIDVQSADYTSLTLTETELGRLKKTSIDYVLCDLEDKPLVCVEFDGLGEGVNLGQRYLRDPFRQVNPWRQQIMELKLKVAHGSTFPFFVMASEQFRDLDPDTELMLVDGIIGEVLAAKAASAEIGQGFEPEMVGYTYEEFMRLTPDEREDVMGDWVVEIEVLKQYEHNPISRTVMDLDNELRPGGMRMAPVTYPAIPDGLTPQERIHRFGRCTLAGWTVTISTRDHGDITRSALLPQFNVPGYSGSWLAESVASLLALLELKRLRQEKPSSGGR